MIKKVDRNKLRVKKHKRIRNKIVGTAERPRLSVYRSANNIFVQVIDDQAGVTLVSASTIEKTSKIATGGNTEAAKKVGEAIAKKAIAKGIDTVVFDRSGYIYTGRVKELADAAREAGLKFKREGGFILAREVKASEYKESLLRINRVSKTVKGGRRISFSVLAAIGNENGKVGIGLGKANGVPDAIRKAVANAKKNLVEVSLKGGTLPHEQLGKFNSTTVLLKPASKGTGVIAGSATREILELVGVSDILTKIRGSKNKDNVARATIDGLTKMRSVEQVARLRGKSVDEILG